MRFSLRIDQSRLSAIVGDFAMFGKADTLEPPVMLVVSKPMASCPESMASRPSQGSAITGLDYFKSKPKFQSTCRLT